MSENHQVLAFDSIQEEAAPDTIERAVTWLISNGYVCEALSECALGSEGGLGHRPGPNWRDVVDLEEEQRRWDLWGKALGRTPPDASEVLGDFLRLSTNCVETKKTRSVETALGLTYQASRPVCPACRNQTPEQVDELVVLIDRWWECERVEMECPTCRVSSRLEDWDWQPVWAFAQASMTFWNWPPISGDAIKRLSTALGGIRIRHLEGRL